MTPESTRGISRLKYESVADGWLARYTREKVTFRQSFFDSKFGGPEESFAAAQKWHQEIRILFPPMNRQEYMNLHKRTNTSGYVGVHKASKTIKKKNGKTYTYDYWIASWIDDSGQKKNKRFVIRPNDEGLAKRKAIEFREKTILQLSSEWGDEYWKYRKQESRLTPSDWKNIYAFEGEEVYRLHRSYERDPSLRSQKLEQFIEQFGKLFCEVCSFDFVETYGTLGINLIEVHHIKPLSELSGNTKICLHDLICICANCHLTVHAGNAVENLEKLKLIFNSKQTTSKGKTSNPVPK